MRALARDLGITERVRFLGIQSDMDPVYRAAESLVHPTLEDTYAMVVLEAMAHGLPVVVSGTPWCGISAELSDGVNALLLKIRSPGRNWQARFDACSTMRQALRLWACRPRPLPRNAPGRMWVISMQRSTARWHRIIRSAGWCSPMPSTWTAAQPARP